MLNFSFQGRAVELTEKSSKTTKLVSTANGDNDRSQLSSNGEEMFTCFVDKSMLINYLT